jgi:glutathione synthase
VNRSLLFVADPLEAFKIAKDSTYAMMREAARRGIGVWACEPGNLSWVRGSRVRAHGALQLDLLDDATAKPDGWYRTVAQRDMDLADFGGGKGCVVMRKDPPFDAEYFYATHLLEQAQREGACVVNDPRALRDHPEKLAILEFPQHIAPTLVTRRAQDVRAFHAEHRDIILKPLDGMGGMGIFRVGPDAMNLGSIVETLARDGTQTLMVQRYVPEIVHGDKRILVIDGQAVPYCLARIPQGSEIRGNLAVGGKGVAQPLSDDDRRIVQAIGPELARRGLLLVGLDVIGSVMTEINVTSPTCFREITEQTGFDVAACFLDALERTIDVKTV